MIFSVQSLSLQQNLYTNFNVQVIPDVTTPCPKMDHEHIWSTMFESRLLNSVVLYIETDGNTAHSMKHHPLYLFLCLIHK
jgi:hypothetical protein